MKLDHFPHVLWLNLNHAVDRRKHMEDLFARHDISHTRIEAILGYSSTLCAPIEGLSEGEIGCVCSHLKALQYFIQHTNASEVIIMEDDVSDAFLPFIPYDWTTFRQSLPDFDIIQLAICSRCRIINQLVRTCKSYHCSAAYLITRSAAEQLLNRHVMNDKYIFHQPADGLLFNHVNAYAMPLFTYLIKDSCIHHSHLIYHARSQKQQLNMWRYASLTHS